MQVGLNSMLQISHCSLPLCMLQVVARACQCMCTMCTLLPSAVTRVAAVAARCRYAADQVITEVEQEAAANQLATPK
jgi:hypothetical protein